MPDQLLPGAYLGIDYGQKHIGIAVGQTVSLSASALEIIQSGKFDYWQRLQQIIDDWKPVGAVIGMPYTADGSPGKIHALIDEFTARFESQFHIPVYRIDERLSSYAARDLPSQATNRKIPRLDDKAAALILQTWFDEHYDKS